MPEALLSDELFSRLSPPVGPWQAVKVLASVDSTNAEAVREPAPWTVVLAEEQRAGRGRLDRVWSTPPGLAVTMSATLPMPGARAADWGWLPLLAGMAVGEALAEAGVAAGWKWPNDVLAWAPGDPPGTGRKICGVLCQGVAATGALDAESLVVVGIGVNVGQTQEQLPITAATSLAVLGTSLRREDVVVSVLAHLADRYAAWRAGGASFASIRDDYRTGCLTIGRRVELHRPGGAVVLGTAVGVDDDGALEAVDEHGQRWQHAAGDVVHATIVD